MEWVRSHLTHSIGRSPSLEVSSPSTSQEILRFMELKICCHVHRKQPPVPTQCHTNLVQNLTFCFVTILISFFHLRLVYHVVSSLQGFRPEFCNYVQFSPMRATCPAHVDFSAIGMKLLSIQFCQSSCHFLFRCSKSILVSSSQLSNSLTLYSFLKESKWTKYRLHHSNAVRQQSRTTVQMWKQQQAYPRIMDSPNLRHDIKVKISAGARPQLTPVAQKLCSCKHDVFTRTTRDHSERYFSSELFVSVREASSSEEGPDKMCRIRQQCTD
jgi:hypothetical protein